MHSTVVYSLLILSAMANYVARIWVLVAFILYLVKDIPFEWWSIVLLFVTLFSTAILKAFAEL